jgi:hypothetical protein
VLHDQVVAGRGDRGQAPWKPAKNRGRSWYHQSNGPTVLASRRQHACRREPVGGHAQERLVQRGLQRGGQGGLDEWHDAVAEYREGISAPHPVDEKYR